MQIAKGAKNVALGKPVTTSVKPFSETQPEALTDGKKEAFDYDTVEMKKGSQWVQVDLGESYKIEAIAIGNGTASRETETLTKAALREMKARGVTTVVNLRSPEEMARIGFDEAALVKELGMTYVYIPMRGNEALPYDPKGLSEFAAAMRSAEGKVLLHCTIAWRASHLWAAYLIQERGVPAATALAHTPAINLMDEHRMDEGGQPLELCLGRTVPGLGRP